MSRPNNYVKDGMCRYCNRRKCKPKVNWCAQCEHTHGKQLPVERSTQVDLSNSDYRSLLSPKTKAELRKREGNHTPHVVLTGQEVGQGSVVSGATFEQEVGE